VKTTTLMICRKTATRRIYDWSDTQTTTNSVSTVTNNNNNTTTTTVLLL